MVGLTKFSTTAQKIHDLVTINETNINSLIAAIPSVADGSTSIGAGILKGLEVGYGVVIPDKIGDALRVHSRPKNIPLCKTLNSPITPIVIC